MDEKTKTNLLKALGILGLSYSPKERLDAAREFMLKETDVFSQEEINAIIEPLEKEKERRSSMGKEYCKRQSFKVPGFSVEFKGKGECAACKAPIEGPTPAWFMKQGAKWMLWCPVPECFPEKHASMMEAHRDYCRWKAGK